MALNGKQAYAIAKKYTNDTVIGLGGIKGKNCIIQSAIKTNGITDVIFQWTADNDVVQTTSIQVADGQDDIAITNVDVNEFNHLICMLSDGTIIDAGEIAVSTKASEMDNDLGLTKVENSTSNGNIKIDGVETTVYTLPTLTKSSVGLENVDNTSDANKPVSTATQTALDTKASTTTLTTHIGDNNIHVTSADKTVWNSNVKSVSSIEAPATTTTFKGIIATTTNNNVTIYDGRSLVCSGMSSGIGWYRIFKISPTHKNQIDFMVALHKTPQSFDSETCKLQITFVYNTNPKILCLAKSTNSLKYPKIRIVKSNVNLTEAYIEVYNTNVANSHYLSAYVTGFTGGNGSMSSVNFTPGEIPDGYTAYEYDIANSGVVSYTPVPASATATGTKGDIAYDSGYMYVCTDTNTWKRTQLSSW